MKRTLALVLTIGACTADSPTDTNPEVDTNTDTDIEADTDTDTSATSETCDADITYAPASGGTALYQFMSVNADDNIVFLATDSDVDATVDTHEWIEWEDAPRRSAYRLDSDGDQTHDEEWQYTWDGDNLVEQTIDSDGDGDVDVRITNTYDGDYATESVTDDGDDGSVDARTTFTWNDGHTEVTRAEDDDADGTPNRLLHFTVTGPRQATRLEADTDGDGTTDEIETWEYNDAGQITEWRQDTNADGFFPEFAQTVEWNAVDWTRIEEVSLEGTAITNVDIFISTYTPELRRNETRVDLANDGLDYRLIYTWTCTPAATTRRNAVRAPGGPHSGSPLPTASWTSEALFLQ